MTRYLDNPESTIQKLIAVNGLHANFHEERMSPEQVRVGVDTAWEIIENLKVLERQTKRECVHSQSTPFKKLASRTTGQDG